MSITALANAFPRQRLSTAAKIANDFQWGKDMTDHLIINHTEDYENRSVKSGIADYDRKLSNYQLYNNMINQKDFERECNPFDLDLGNLKDEIKPYNKTYNKINVLLGEELKRPFDYRTAILDQEGIKSKLIARNLEMQNRLDTIIQEVTALIQNHYAQQIQPQDAQDGPEAQQAAQQQEQELQQKIAQVVDMYMAPEELEQLQQQTYLDRREVFAYKTLEALTKTLDLVDMKNDGFKHGLIAGEEVVWVGSINGEPLCRVLNPLGVFYDKNPDTKWIQKGTYAGYRFYMNSPDILDVYGDTLKEKDIKAIEGQTEIGSGIRNDYVGKTMKYPDTDIAYAYGKRAASSASYHGQYGTNKDLNTQWECYHVEWKSQRQIWFQKFINEYGDTQTEILSEDFHIPVYAEKVDYVDEYGKKKVVYLFDGMELEKGWITDVWESTRLGDEIYTNIRRKDIQFRRLSNPNNVSLGYHGVVYSNMNAPAISLMDRMKPFQYLLFIIVHRLKEFVAQDRAPAFEFDITQVDSKIGLQKTLYYLDKLNIHFYNPLNNAEEAGAYQRGAPGAGVDRSTMQHINNYVQLMDAIDAQISDVAGVTRQREGQTTAYEAVSNTQQSIVQSTHITEVYFQTHAKLWEHILNSLLHVAQVKWKDSPKLRQYILDDMSIELLNGEDIDFVNADLGVFVTNAKRDNEIFNEIKKLAEFAVSSGQASIPDIIKLIESGSLPKLKRVIQIMDSRNKRVQEQAQQAQAEAEQKQHDQAIELEEVRNRGAIEVARIKAEVDMAKLSQEEKLDKENRGREDTPEPDSEINTGDEKRIEDKKIRLEEEKVRAQKQKATQTKSSK